MSPYLHVLSTLLACSFAFAALTPDETPRNPGEWGFRPPDGQRSAVDPPGFVWRPQRPADTYHIQIAADSDFDEILYEARGLHLYCHCPPRTFGPGTYHWRFRFTDPEGRQSQWSSIRSFTIDEDSVPFPMPPREELLSRIPGRHPRLFLRPPDVERFRELADGQLHDRWQAILDSCDNLLDGPPDTSEPPKYPAPDLRRTDPNKWRSIWWGNRRRVVAVTNGAATLAFAWLIGGNEQYAELARKLILAACKWDPKGATGYRYNDEAGMPFAYFTARTYTWLHDYLTEADREVIRNCMQVRGREMYDHLSGKMHIWRPYSSHSNRAWHYLGEVATAFYGEIDGAGDWAWFAMNVFFNSYPVWNDSAGGWHEGIAYWNSYINRVTWWLATMRSSYGIDGYRKPFFSNAGDFPLYVVPPGETMGGFGDLTMGYTASRCSSLVSILARSAQNPYWQWFVEKSGGGQLPGGYMGFIYGTLPPVQPKPPTDLPDSILFPGVGLAVLHNDLVHRDRDVQFMLKSSPMGSQSHGYEAQNSFLLSVAGRPIFIRTGRRDLYGSPHHKNWMWHTKSVNSILVDGEGQLKRSSRARGGITAFSTSDQFDYVVGQAAEAYRNPLTRFTRAVLFIKPHAIVMFDVLRAPEPAKYQWLLHSPNEMHIDGRTIRADAETAAAVVQILHPQQLQITQTDQFDPPPDERIDLTQWHLTAATIEKRAAADFVSVIRPLFDPQQQPPSRAEAMVSQNALGCRIELPDGEATVVWRKSGDGMIRCGELGADADAACVVTDETGEIRSTFTYGGEKLLWAGRPHSTTGS